METLQPTKQNDMFANNNNYKVSKNKHTTDEDKNKQIDKSTWRIFIKLKNTKNWTWQNTKQTWTLHQFFFYKNSFYKNH